MRNILESQIVKDAMQGDTTVLAEILLNLSDEVVYESLGDDEQRLVQELRVFLKTYGIKVAKDETLAMVELMMDNHICIEFEGVEYYLNEDNSMFTERDEVLYEYLELHNQL
jgi:hypothetical protein